MAARAYTGANATDKEGVRQLDPAREQVLRAELDEATRERARLDAVIDYLQIKLGILGQPTPAGSGPSNGGGGGLPVDGDVMAAVREGEFYGVSGPKAAVRLFQRIGSKDQPHPLKTDVLFDAIRAGGCKVEDRQGFYRTLFRDSRFTRVGKSLWGLSEWYPPTARRAAKDAAAADAAELGLDDDNGTSSPDEAGAQPGSPERA